jgi:hypothetical protein
MITIGLDFGTHQTKICVESKDGFELKYSFFKFNDCDGKAKYTFPSIIHVNKDNYLTYGYIKNNNGGDIKRYFKQGTFTSVNNMGQEEAIYYSIWYLAYIIFDLEDIYGKDLTIQMGVPTDCGHYEKQKELASRILLSAYRLVEDVFNNDKQEFLNTKKSDLMAKTDLVPFDQTQKDYYQIFILPEAYACLMPLIRQSKIDGGMSLMIDIGGGTTDISFFSIEHASPDILHVYDFYSINKGLNFLSDADNMDADRLDSNLDRSNSVLISTRIETLQNDIRTIHNSLIDKLRKELKRQSSIPVSRLMSELMSRPIVYTGGGSTFAALKTPYGGFKDVIQVSKHEWRTAVVAELNKISALGLCPILATAYGLSISVTDDDIKTEDFSELFSGVRNYVPDGNKSNHNSRMDYYTDYNAMK